MKILTRSERDEIMKKIRDEAERLRASMTPEQLARAHGRRHQSTRERARRLKQINSGGMDKKI